MEPSNSLFLIESWLLSLELLNKVHYLFDTWITFSLHLRGSQLFCLTIEDFIEMTKLRAWLWYQESRNLHNSMILSTLNISSRDFAFGFLKRFLTNEDVFLTYKLMIIPLTSRSLTTLAISISLKKIMKA